MSAGQSTHRRGVVWWLRAAVLVLLTLVAGTWAAGAAAKRNLMRRYPPPGEMIDVGGFKMHLHCTGSGEPTVILIAGLDDFSISWSQVQPEVARTTRVCSYDRAGLGWSEASPDPRTIRNMVDELHRLLANAEVHPPYVLAAHSFGGAIARSYVESYPHEVVGLVLVDAAPTALFDRIPAWNNAIEGKIQMFQVLARMNSLGLLALVPQSVPNRGFPEEALAQYRAISAATGYWSVAVAENKLFKANLAELGAHNPSSLGDVPIVILSRGLWDPIPGFSEVQNKQAESEWRAMQVELAGLSTNSSQVIAEKSEHFIQLQQPDLVIQAIRSLIERARK